jgi:hypothetical protein
MSMPPDSSRSPLAADPLIRIWTLHCPFRKSGSPVVGTMGSSIRTVILIETDMWKRLCEEVPQLQTTQFEVGTIND